VLVHDGGRMTEAAHAWFILQWHGVDARVLDGGSAALIGQPNFVPDRAPSLPAAVVFRCPDGHGPRVRPIQRDELRERLGTGLRVLDARTRAERVGEDLRANARGPSAGIEVGASRFSDWAADGSCPISRP
jgi:3-mercaptopyruvate sulfurtransferase SseA